MMSSRTIFLSKLIGLYCVIIALSMMTRRQATVETVTALLRSPSMMLIVGIVALATGLAMVLVHNIWSGGALAVVVTLVGWITLIKSLFFLFVPPEMETTLFLEHLHTFLLVRGYFAHARRVSDLRRIYVKDTVVVSRFRRRLET
jgi:vacuolar-type H+-ATPase subunit I/STV1